MVQAPTFRVLADFALAVIILTAGLAALAAMLSRGRWKEKTLLWFGLFAVVYGIRQLAKDPLLQPAFEGAGNLRAFLVAWLDFIIVIPVMLFAEEVFGRGWRSTMRLAVWISAVYAILGIALGLATGKPYLLPEPGSALVWCLWLGVALAAILGKYRPPPVPDAPLFFLGTVAFVAFVVNEHLAPQRYRAEPVGMFIFIGCLGVIAVRRMHRNEQKLVSVEQEMASARRIQFSILPDREPLVPGLDIAARYSPMAAVAGDFYDFVLLDPNRVGILIADVAGHGVPAALISSMVKVALAAEQAHAGDPGLVLSGLNQIFCRQRTGQFITAGYLVVDPKRRSAVYSGAAHPPLVLFRRSSQSVLRFENKGMFLGFRAGERYSNLEIPLLEGDRLVLCTDGLLEATNRSDEAFEGQIDKRLYAHADLPAQQFADALLADLSAWSAPKGNYAQEDDLTLLVVDVVWAC